jgi:hypothetical protein
MLGGHSVAPLMTCLGQPGYIRLSLETLKLAGVFVGYFG